MKRILAGLFAALALAGCATAEMNSYIGQPVQAAMVRRGPPTNVFDMPDGRRAFQWLITSSMRMPTYTTTQANIYAPPGAFASYNASQMTTGGGVMTTRCLYTMYATWQGEAWVLTGYEKPRLDCI